MDISVAWLPPPPETMNDSKGVNKGHYIMLFNDQLTGTSFGFYNYFIHLIMQHYQLVSSVISSSKSVKNAVAMHNILAPSHNATIIEDHALLSKEGLLRHSF